MNKIHELLNEMLAIYWSASIQHRSHIAVIEAEGASLLASEMETKIADEPETIANLQNRLLDLGGQISFTVKQPNIGKNLREALQNDYELQKMPERDSMRGQKLPMMKMMPPHAF